MPFDGKELDETTKTLIAARELLEKEGWCKFTLKDADGRRCTLGAVAAARTGSVFVNGDIDQLLAPALNRLLVAIPEGERFAGMTVPPGPLAAHQASGYVCNYNNSRTGTQDILEWFDRAIAARP